MEDFVQNALIWGATRVRPIGDTNLANKIRSYIDVQGLHP